MDNESAKNDPAPKPKGSDVNVREFAKRMQRRYRKILERLAK